MRIKSDGVVMQARIPIKIKLSCIIYLCLTLQREGPVHNSARQAILLRLPFSHGIPVTAQGRKMLQSIFNICYFTRACPRVKISIPGRLSNIVCLRSLKSR